MQARIIENLLYQLRIFFKVKITQAYISQLLIQLFHQYNNSSQIEMIQDQKCRNFISGLIAGFISVTVCNPLDITRTRLNIMNSPSHNSSKYQSFSHTMKTILKEEGFKGFYVGYRTNVVAIPLFHSLFFPIYQYTKSVFYNKGYNKYLEYFLATATAGTTCNIITNPIWVVRTRVMVQYLHPESRHYQNSKPLSVMKRMIKQQGFASLFKGLSASILSVSNASIYFICYQTLKQMMKIDKEGFSPTNIFIASTISKIISSIATYPLIVVRTVLHDHRHDYEGHLLDGKKLTFRYVVSHIMKQSGVNGFYAGLKPDLIRLIPSNAILFITYEYMKKYWPLLTNSEYKQ